MPKEGSMFQHEVRDLNTIFEWHGTEETAGLGMERNEWQLSADPNF